ncbi:MAG TPA: hypothetical protein G4O01_08655 [Dehalococcoidia bacterium]|jgi:hypothetical protein|nr:hypothetical protein [Dehalococcoidia bacterium]
MNRESGQALIMALILLAMGVLLVVSLLGNVFTNLGYHRSIECKTLNGYSADSGVEYALFKLYDNPGGYTETPLEASFTLNDRTVDVTAEYQGGGIYKITSAASGGGCGTTTITTYVNLSAGAFSYVLVAKNYISLQNTTVDSSPNPGEARIHSNGNIDFIGGEVTVNGDASAVGNITGQESVTGVVLEGVSPIEFPGDYSDLYRAMAQEGGTYVGDMTLQKGTFYLGPLYIDGSLNVKPDTTVILEGPVYVTGDIDVQGGHFEGKEQVYADGDIRMSQGAYGATEDLPIITTTAGDIDLVGPVVSAVVYAPNGIVTLTNIDVYGAIGGVDINISNATVTYAQELQGREDLPGGYLATIAYTLE